MPFPSIREISCTIGYECCACGKLFEFPADAHSHGQWCRAFDRDNQIKATKQLAQIKIETFKADGSKSGIALSDPEPIEIVPDLVAMRRAVRKMVGNWS